MNMMCDLSTQIERHWPAHLRLDLVKSGNKTQMKHMAFKGPLRVQRPFYPEQDVCHIYLLHPPGGLVSGDDLHIDIRCQQGSHALLTTPSAGKIYQADSKNIKQLQSVDIEVNNGVCEWLPMETIVFDGAQGQLTTNIQLHGEAKFIGIDVFCLGRPKSELPFKSGSISQKLSIYRNHRPLLLERQVLSATDPLLSAASGFHGHLVSGTLTVVGFEHGEKMVAPLRDYMATESEGVLSITYRLNVLLVRYLGDCSEEAQRLLRACWAFLRPLLLERPACYPRIWNT
ncbi:MULTISPECIES: urease accessory protein UreD [unclassified Vibrio]|uniref:Urease accessory protein UreD n=1 Tax=Vibrio sp. HB236076 TaxID=3232307 RepID=A0AB39HE10_9VIBR|nr:urease accessory protein UreD [Vibrio sp. HB161653]MDP5252802.1 urease accessory protein UreD [Vibrio sp. HB161653]